MNKLQGSGPKATTGMGFGASAHDIINSPTIGFQYVDQRKITVSTKLRKKEETKYSKQRRSSLKLNFEKEVKNATKFLDRESKHDNSVLITIDHQTLINGTQNVGVKAFSIGESNFRNMMQKGGHFIDKSLLIKEIIDDKAVVKLILRPRRFGKTLNMSMLESFFSNECKEDQCYFQDLNIWRVDNRKYHSHQGKYPVVFLTFKDIQSNSFEEVLKEFKVRISKKYKDYKKLLFEGALKEDKDEQETYQKIINKTADFEDFKQSLKNLTEYLFKQYKSKVIILVDEYDTPVNASYQYKYYEEMAKFMRGLLGAALKDNQYLEQAVITGILRVSKESIFSGLNNIKVYSVLSEKYNDYFGFTQEEVKALFPKGNSDQGLLSEIEDWYGGYQVGKKLLYNPWALINFIAENKEFRDYWINTSENKLIENLLTESDEKIKENVEKLLKNDVVHDEVDEHVVFKDINEKPNVLWSFLLLSGYLTTKLFDKKEKKTVYALIIPNRELFAFYKKIALSWHKDNLYTLEFENQNKLYLLKQAERIAYYRKELGSSNCKARELAAYSLRSLDIIDNHIVKAYARNLDHSETREHAIKALSELSTDLKNEFIIQAHIENLSYPSLEVRESALRELNNLAELNSDNTLESLNKNLLNSDPGVRQTASDALKKSLTTEEFKKIHLQNLLSSDPGVRQTASDALKKSLTTEEFKKIYLQNLLNSDSGVRQTSVCELILMGEKNSQIENILLNNLSDDDPWVRERATEDALIYFGSNFNQFLNLLTKNLNDINSKVRQAAAEILIFLDQKEIKVFHVLFENLSSDIKWVKKNAQDILNSIKNIPEEIIKRCIENIFEDGKYRKDMMCILFSQASMDDNNNIIEMLIKFLTDNIKTRKSKLIEINRGILEILINIIKPHLLDRVDNALVELSDSNNFLIEMLMQKLTNPKVHPWIVQHSTELLNKINLANKQISSEASQKIITIFFKNLGHTDSWVRECSAEALINLGQTDIRIIKALIKNLKNSTSGVGENSINLLERLAKLDLVKPIVVQSLIDSLKNFVKEDDGKDNIIKILIKLDRTNSALKEIIINEIMKENNYFTLRKLKELYKLGLPKTFNQEITKKLINMEPWARQNSAEILIHLNQADALIVEQALIKNLEENHIFLRQRAIRAFGEWKQIGKNVMEIFIKNLKDKDPDIRRTVIEVFAKLGKDFITKHDYDHLDIIELIKQRLKDEEVRVQGAAIYALEKLGITGYSHSVCLLSPDSNSNNDSKIITILQTYPETIRSSIAVDDVIPNATSASNIPTIYGSSENDEFEEMRQLQLRIMQIPIVFSEPSESMFSENYFHKLFYKESSDPEGLPVGIATAVVKKSLVSNEKEEPNSKYEKVCEKGPQYS